MQHLEVSGRTVLHIGRTVPKVNVKCTECCRYSYTYTISCLTLFVFSEEPTKQLVSLSMRQAKPLMMVS